MPTVNERCKILQSLNRVYVFEIVLLLVPRLKILRRRGLSYFGIFEKQEAQSSSQETNHNSFFAFIVCVDRRLMALFGADTIRGVLHVSKLCNLSFVHIFHFVSVQRNR